MNKDVCPLGAMCAIHECVHGGEAEELRKRLEALLSRGKRVLSSRAVQHILDDVDARDAVAWLEHVRPQ